ncbi:MAG: hypothetical protein ACK41V_19530 [Acidovorax sp.]|uniref:hypothetical protein n=1 Tax=Acidovorax sp. TaxID=1872122 RepID=UPI00391BB629
MKKINFLYQDSAHLERQSDGLNFVIAPEINGGAICVYCNEYDSFALSIADFEKNNFVVVSRSNKFRAATLEEICQQGLSTFVDVIRTYDTQSKQEKYVYLHQDASIDALKYAFFTFKNIDYQQEGVYCNIPEFYDEGIYFFSVEEDCFWRSLEDFGSQSKATKFKAHKVVPTSLSKIYEAGYLDFVVGVKEFSLGREGLVGVDVIEF